MLFSQSVLGLSRDDALWGVDKAEILRQMFLRYEYKSGKPMAWGKPVLDRISELIDQKLNEEAERRRNGADA